MEESSFFFGTRKAYNPRHVKKSKGNVQDKEDIYYSFGEIVGVKASKVTNAVFMRYLFEFHDLSTILSERHPASPISARLCFHLGSFGMEIEAYARIANLNPKVDPDMRHAQNMSPSDLHPATEALTAFTTSLGVTAATPSLQKRVMKIYNVDPKIYLTHSDHLDAVANAILRLSRGLLDSARSFYEGDESEAPNSPFAINVSRVDVHDHALQYHTKKQDDQVAHIREQAATVRSLLVDYYQTLTGQRLHGTQDDPDHLKIVPAVFIEVLKSKDGNPEMWSEMYFGWGTGDVLKNLLLNNTQCYQLRFSTNTALKLNFLVEGLTRSSDWDWFKTFTMDDFGSCANFIDPHPAPRGTTLPMLRLFQVEMAIGYMLLDHAPFLSEADFA